MSIRVLITVPWGERLGGAETMLWTFLSHVDRTRLEPIVVFFEPGSFERDVAGLDIQTAVIETGRLRHTVAAARALRALARLLKRESPDLLLNWMPKTQLYGAPAALLAGRASRVVWWQHGVIDGGWMNRLAATLPSLAVGCSSTISAQGQAKLWPRRRIFVVHPGVPLPSDLAATNDGEMRRTLGFPPEATVIGMVARLQADKGQARFLRALSDLRRRGLAVHGLLVGGDTYGFSPGYEAELRSLIADLDLTDHVTMTGHVADVEPYIRAMDISVNASDQETFGVALLESMALGVPPVAPVNAGSTEYIEQERSGLLVPPRDHRSLANVLERLVRDPRLRRRLGEEARRSVERQFTAEAMTEALQSRLEQLAREPL